MAEAPARVVLTGGLSRRYTGGVQEFAIEAKNLRGLIKAMDRLYPGLGEHLEEETTIAIDGAILASANMASRPPREDLASPDPASGIPAERQPTAPAGNPRCPSSPPRRPR